MAEIKNSFVSNGSINPGAPEYGIPRNPGNTRPQEPITNTPGHNTPISSGSNTSLNVTGINVNGVSEIQNAIDTYKNSIIKLTNIAVTTKEIQNAIKGAAVEAQVTVLAETVQQQVVNLMSTLDNFKAKLDTVKATYKSNDDSSTSVSGVINSIKS